MVLYLITFRKMTIEEPSFYEGYVYRLLSHVNLKEFDKALELEEYMENLHPERVDAHAFRYHIYHAMGDEDKAEMEKEIVKNIDPKFTL